MVLKPNQVNQANTYHVANQNGAYRGLFIPKLTEINVLGVIIGAIAGVACIQGWESQENRNGEVSGGSEEIRRGIPRKRLDPVERGKQTF
jgi:hypothetical protein